MVRTQSKLFSQGFHRKFQFLNDEYTLYTVKFVVVCLNFEKGHQAMGK